MKINEYLSGYKPATDTDICKIRDNQYMSKTSEDFMFFDGDSEGVSGVLLTAMSDKDADWVNYTRGKEVVSYSTKFLIGFYEKDNLSKMKPFCVDDNKDVSFDDEAVANAMGDMFVYYTAVANGLNPETTLAQWRETKADFLKGE